MATPGKLFCDWAAGAFVELARQKAIPDELGYLDLAWYPFLDSLWECVEETDRDIILDLLRSPETATRGALLSRGLPNDLEVTQMLTQAFESEKDADVTLALFHELAFRTDDEAAKRRLADYVLGELDRFLEGERKYFSAEIVRACRNRMDDPKFVNKRWMYLLSAHAFDNAEDTASFIKGFLDDPDPFVAKMARESLEL